MSRLKKRPLPIARNIGLILFCACLIAMAMIPLFGSGNSQLTTPLHVLAIAADVLMFLNR